MLMPTDPEVLKFVQDTLDFYPADAVDWPLEKNREFYATYCAEFRHPRPDGVEAWDDHVVVPESHAVPVRHYQLKGRKAEGVTVLYAHGGGFVLGNLDSHDDVCAEICANTGLPVVAVDYRLAPEHVYPAQLDDVSAVYLDLIASGEQVVVAGDSAGANLAAALCQRAQIYGFAMPLGQALIYPGFLAEMTQPSFIECAEAALLSSAECEYYRQVYAGEGVTPPLSDPCYSPIAADAHFEGLPPAIITAAEIDPLRDEARDYADRLRPHAAVDYRMEEGLVHGYLRARHRSEKAAASFRAICDAIAGFAAA